MHSFYAILTGLILSTNCFAAGYGSINNKGVIVIDGQVISGNLSSSGVTGSGKIISKSHTLSAFNHIVSDLVADIRVLKAKRYLVTIKADENIIDFISAEIVNNELLISAEQSYSTQQPVRIIIETPYVNVINQSGVGSIEFNHVSTDELTIIIEGQGNVSGTGQVEKLNAKIEGVGNLLLSNLQAKDVSVEIDGTGNAEVNVTNTLAVIIDGVGDVIYSGKPKIIEQSIDGVGTVRH